MARKLKQSVIDSIPHLRESLEEEENKESGKRRLKQSVYDEMPYLSGEIDADVAPLGGNRNSIFKSGGFSDGVTGVGDFFGDLGQTVAGTAGDLGLGILKGAGRLVEGVVDLGTYGVAGVADLIGKDEFAAKAKETARYSFVDDFAPIKTATDFVDRYSVLGDKADMVAEGLGQVGGIILTGGLGAAAGLGTGGVAALTTGITGLSSMGTGMGSAYEAGADDKDAFVYGLGAGAIEAGTELLFGGLGKGVKALGVSRGIGGLDDMFAKKLSSSITRAISNETVQKVAGNTIEAAVKAGGEGAEEVLSGIGSAVMKKLTYEDDESLGKLIEDENLLEQFVVGAITSSIAQGADFVKATSSGRDFVTGYTDNEQAVIDKVVEKRVAEREKDGGKLTTKEIGAIEEQVREDMEHGQLDIDTIEEVLGGDDYTAYRDTVKSEDELKAEYDALAGIKKSELTTKQEDRLAELKGMNLSDTSKRDGLRQKLDEAVRPQLEGSRLAETYRERERKGKAFEADLSRYKGRQREAVERAVNSGVLNNTYRSHELVDVLSKIEAEKGISFDYTNNAKLKESIFAVEGKTVNGFANKKTGAVTLNVQSPKAWQSVVGHEITHVLEGTESYSALQQAVYAYANIRGELETRRSALTELYSELGADVESELTADLVGDYLFTDRKFIDHLTGNRTLFQKVYDEIKYLWKVATGKERYSMERLVHEFDRAWKEISSDSFKGKTDEFEFVSDPEAKEYSDDEVQYSIRKEEPPKETGIAYKVFYVKDGKLYPPMVANPGGADTPMGVWLNADVGEEAPPSKTGRAQVKAGGKGTQGGSGSLAFRPGWHLGDLPRASQFDRLNPETGKKELFPENFVWAEVEYAKDVDYQEEAMSYGYTDNGKFRHAYAGLPKLPENGYYRYRTNPKPDTVPWVITGAMKVNRLLSDAEVNEILEANGVPAVHRQGGDVGLEKFGFGEEGKVQYSVSDKNIKDVSTDYAYGETYYTMSYEQDGKVVGTLEYGEYEGQPNVKMVEVLPEYRRKGIGKKLLQELQKKYPDQEIDFGMSTPDGTKLLESITYEVTDDAVVADIKKLKDLQSELDYLQGKLDVLYDTENLTEAQEAEMHKLGDRWQEVYETIYALESELKGKKASRTFVKTDEDVQYSVSDSAAKSGVEYDRTSESYSPVQYSISSWEETDYVTNRKKAAADMAKTIGITEEKAAEYIDSVNSIAKIIADDKERLSYEPSPDRSAFVSNAEYGGSIDFSTICKKRRLFTGTFEAIQNALPNTALTADEVLEIRKMMKDKGYEVSCGLCYVEGSRTNMGLFTKQFIERYAATNPEYVPNMAEMNTATGQEKLRREHPEVYEAYEYFMNHYGRLSPTDKALFASQQKPKMYQMATEYKGEILKKFGKKNSSVETKNKNGGLRLQSFSDFEIIHLIDSMQVIMDMSRVGLAGQAYTKVPDFAWALGDTGLKINLSLIAKDVDADGRLILDEVEGMKESDAMALRDRYSDNVGTIIVVFNDAQLKAAMADERIDYIIPYHRSQWKTSQYEAMGLPKDTQDYTPWQNESYIEDVFDKNGKKLRPDNYMPNTYWDFGKTGRENAEAYLAMCAQNNRRPKFSHLLVDNGDGSYSLQPDGSTDGYWKTLIDFKMYNNEGVGVPQNPVVPDFNMEEAQRMLNEYTGGHAKFPVAQDIVDAFVAKHPDNIAPVAGVQYSVSPETDADYMAAVERGDMDTAQRMVDEAAKAAGYTRKLYHGTASKFNVFGFGRTGIFTTNNFDMAKTYGDNVMTLYGKEGANVLTIDAKESPHWAIEVSKDVLDFSEYPLMRGKERYSSNDISLIAFREGYDVVVIDNVYDNYSIASGNTKNGLGTDVVYKDPNQVKSSEAITYDDNGNVIPLSERFNEKNKDLRYSVAGDGDQYAPVGDYRTPFRELALEEAAPVATNTPTATVNTPTAGEAYPEDYAPLTEEEANTLANDRLASISDEDVPPEVPEPYYGDGAETTADEVEPVEVEGAAPKTRKQLHMGIMDDIKATFSGKGFDFDGVLAKAKNLSTFATVDNTPQRVMEKALGYKAGGVLADITVNKVAQNESAGIKWLNSFTDRRHGLLAQISKQYRIKPGSKESAAAQMYAEGFYVDEYNDIIKYGDDELALDFPDLGVQERIKGLAHDPRIRRIYDETLDAINASRERNAYPVIQRLDNYFLHFRAMDDTFSRLGLPFNPNDIRAKDLPTDLNGVTADLKPGQPYFASAMHRTGKRTSFDLLGGLERYLTAAKNQIYHIDDIQTLRALRNYMADTYGQANGLEGIDDLTEEEVQERIDMVYNSHLSTFAKFLNEEANMLAGKTALIDRGLEGIIGRRGMTFLDTVNRQVGSNMVGFNISSSLTNFLSVAQTFAKTNKFDFTKAFAQTVSNKISSIFGKSDGFVENSPVMIRRKGADRFYRTPWQKAGDAGYVLMSAVDDISSELIARTKYNELTRKGMDEQTAHFETDKWVSRLMGDRSLGQQPQLYNSKTLGIFTKFQLEVRNQLDSQFYDTIQEAKVSAEDIENRLARNARIAAKVTATFAELAIVQHLYGKAFESVAGYNPAFDIISTLATMFGFDDEEDSEDTALDNIEQGFLDLLEDLPYTSTFTGGRIPISSALPVAELIKGVDQYGNEKSRLETLGEAAPYYVLPGGYGQIKKTAAGLGMFSDEHPVSGSYTDSGKLRFPVEDTPANRVQAAVFGQYASKNAREYFDNGYAPLAEKQIQEYADLDLPIREYREIREGLSGLSKLEEKLDYIAGLDLPVDKKNILANNVSTRKDPIDLTDYEDFGSLEEFDFASKNPEKYAFLQEGGVSYADYTASEDSKEAYNWAYKNPEGYAVSRAVTDDVIAYRQYAGELNDITADKDANGKSISGSRKEKVIQYINGLELDYYSKIILLKKEYPSEDAYNAEIIEYLNGREDISYSDMVTILTELGFRVTEDGQIYAD